METYLETTHKVYKEAALNPDKGLCCTTTPVWQLPDLNIPKKMLEMNLRGQRIPHRPSPTLQSAHVAPQRYLRTSCPVAP